MENTYLDPQAMLRRINEMKSQSEAVFMEIEKTKDVMNRLREYFEGMSADKLQKKFEELADTYRSLHEYLQEKAELMNQLTTNVKQTDEE